MDGQLLRELIARTLREELLEAETVMRTNSYHGGKWTDTLRLVIGDLFKNVGGVKQIEARSPEEGSYIRIALNNGDVIVGKTIKFPMYGTVGISGRFGKLKQPINGPQSINLVSTMYKIWSDYDSKGMTAG